MRKSFVLGALALAVAVLAAVLGTTTGSAQSASCGLTNPAFCETFNQGPSSVRGRAGDLNPVKWGVGRLAPSDFSRGGVANPVYIAPVPPCRVSLSLPSVFPPDDTQICDPSGSRSAQLMTAVAIQNYGNNSYMIRQPFDFANRTGKIVFDADLWGKQLGTYIEVEITEDPIPAPTFREFENFETGPLPRSGLILHFQNMCDPDVALGKVYSYSNYQQTELQPTVFTQGTGCARIRQGSLNHVEIQISRTHIEVFASDYSNDDGQTFPNSRRLYAADMNLGFTRGYVHMSARNHASAKYGFGPDGVYHWDNIGFDGPALVDHRGYEVPDSKTLGTYESQAIMNLGYVLLDGSTGRAAGIYDPNNRVSALQIPGVDLSGATGARLSLSAFVNANNFSHTASTSWGWSLKFNGGTTRTRMMTASEAAAVNTVGAAGNMTFVIDVPVSDLRNGTNTLEMLPINLPMDFPPAIANIDLLVMLTSSTIPPPPPPGNVRIIR
jgi:hypothetical protein